ncbi:MULTISPECIES: hypothetical protein [Kitasatospora]|nr:MULTISPECIES: hypothetical protein [Kitasatospora]
MRLDLETVRRLLRQTIAATEDPEDMADTEDTPGRLPPPGTRTPLPR